MESEENIAGGYSAAGGWAGGASDSGPQSGANVGSKDFGQSLQDRPQGPAIGGMDLSPGLTRSVYGTTYGTQLAGLNQAKFNDMFSITDKNPYGKFGKMTSLLGIPPDLLDFTQMSLQNRKAIANNQFSKFANPQNMKGLPGYNPNFDTAPPGQVRSGVQKAGYMTAFGPIMGQAREQTPVEMGIRGLFGLIGGLPGKVLGQLGTQEYGLPGLPGFNSFDPNNPRAGGGILGAMLGGVNPSQAADKAAQAVDSLRARFSPTLAPTTNAGIGSLTPASYETRADIRDRVTSTVPAMGSVFEVDGRSFIAGKNGPIELKGTAEQQVVSPSPLANSFSPGTELRTPTEQYARETGQLAYPSSTSTDGSIYAPNAASYLTGTSDRKAQAQNVGLFGENPKAAGFRTIGEMIQSVINEENLPDNQNMYGSGTPDLNDILNMYGMGTVGQ